MSETMYHVLIDNRQAGPYSLTSLQEMWRSGLVSAETPFWKQGQLGWEPLGKMASQLGDVPASGLRHLMPAPGGATAPPPRFITGLEDSGPASPPRVATSGLAIAGFICGVGGLLLGVPAILAIVFGHLARRQIQRSAGALKGGGLATTGLVLGYLVLALFAGVSGFIAVADHYRGTEVKDLLHARQIGSAVLLYAHDHQGRTPAEFGSLLPVYIPDNAVFASPLAPDKKSLGYELALPDTDLHTVQDPANTVLVRGRYQTRKGFRTFFYVDGHSAAKRE